MFCRSVTAPQLPGHPGLHCALALTQQLLYAYLLTQRCACSADPEGAWGKAGTRLEHRGTTIPAQKHPPALAGPLLTPPHNAQGFRCGGRSGGLVWPAARAPCRRAWPWPVPCVVGVVGPARNKSPIPGPIKILLVNLRHAKTECRTLGVSYTGLTGHQRQLQ